MLVGVLRHLVHRALVLNSDRRWAGDVSTFMQLRGRRSATGRRVIHVRLAGQRLAVHVRGGTLDLMMARQILCEDSEYRLPVPIDPDLIVDVGANIGLTALYFAATYPRARIICFEPLPENIELLRLNTAPFADRITVEPKGLGEEEGTFAYQTSDDPRNYGGGTFHDVGCDPTRRRDLPVTTLRAVCLQMQIDRIDLLKIDTEGAEWSVLQGAPPGIIAGCQAIIGELHSHHDQEFLSSLSQTHRLGYAKPLDQPHYPFVAVRKAEAVAATNAPRLVA